VEAQTEAALEAETQESKVRNAPEPMAMAEVTTDEEFKDKSFNKAQYDRVLQQVKADIERNKPISVTGIQQNVKKDIKDTKVSQVRDVMAELQNRGYLQSVPQPAAVRDRVTGVRYTPTPQYQATQNIKPQLKTPDVSYRRQIDIANEAIAKNNKIMEDLKLDLDSVRQFGRDLQGKRTSENAINYEISRLGERNKQYNSVVNEAQQGLQRLGRLPYVPKVTPDFNRAQKIERKVAAAKARSVADQVKEKVQSNKPVFTPILNKKQEAVFNSIRKRLDGYGLKDVRLSAEQVVDGGEGSYNPTGRVISLSMGLYDPKLSETELFNRVGEVLDHETTHALKEMNVITPAEWKTLTDAAAKMRYTKIKSGEKQQRKYSYLDRAKRMYGDMDPEIQAEEAVAEMFRDYNAGRLSMKGKPVSLFNKIKNFFKAIIGGAKANGFTDVQSIFDDIVVGNIGQRERGIAAQEQTEPASSRQSRLAATEEETTPEQNIRMPLSVAAPNDQIRAEIQRMTNQNRPLVKQLIRRIDERYGTKSGDNAKDLSKVTQKARRPSILAKKPWHDVSHIRDSYRFKTVIDDFRAVPAIFNELLADGISLVKIDTNKLFEPKEWGWRIIAFDLRMPNGQLVEWYLPLRELEVEKKARGHLIFEEWRNKTQEELSAQRDAYFAAIARSYRNYDEAFQAALDRMNTTRQDAEASWRRAESSLLEAARNARRSSGVGISSAATAEAGITTPSEVRTDVDPSALNISAREEPSSMSAKGSAILSTSDDYVTDLPVEQQVKFSRLSRSPSVSGLQDFIRNNPDGFTIDPVSMEPASGGFVVAPLKEAEIIVGETLPEEVLLGYIEDNKDISRAVNKPVYLGGWFDTDSQQYFLDNTLILPTAEEALYIAEAADQLAIFDLNNFEEIRTNEGIRRLQESGAYRGDTAIGYQRNLAEVGRRFAEARNNRNTRQKEQLTGRVEAPKPYISDQAVRETSPDLSFFNAVDKIPEKKRFSRISTPDGPLLSDETNTGTQRFTVFRLGDDQDLVNRNAADINGIYHFMEMMDEKNMGYSDRLTKYTVEVTGGFTTYTPLRRGVNPSLVDYVYDSQLGKTVQVRKKVNDPKASLVGNNYSGDSPRFGKEVGNRWYSFPDLGENKTWRVIGEPEVYPSMKQLLRNADAWIKERGGNYAKSDIGQFGAAMANQLYPNTQYAQEVERWLARDYNPNRWEFDNELGTVLAKKIDPDKERDEYNKILAKYGIKFSRLTIPLTPEQRAAQQAS
jgi:hypothetical protein